MRSYKDTRANAGPALPELYRRAEQVLASSAVGADSHVSINKQDQWYVFQGRVPCSGTKAALFSLVPIDRGAQWIIDRIHVGRAVLPSHPVS